MFDTYIAPFKLQLRAFHQTRQLAAFIADSLHSRRTTMTTGWRRNVPLVHLCGAMIARYYLWPTDSKHCLSVYLSHAAIVSKRLHRLSCFWRRLFRLTLCSKEIMVSLKNPKQGYFPLELCSKVAIYKNFATARLPSQSVFNSRPTTVVNC